jgi:hypothetical protein
MADSEEYIEGWERLSQEVLLSVYDSSGSETNMQGRFSLWCTIIAITFFDLASVHSKRMKKLVQ